MPRILTHFRELETKARAWLDAEGVPASGRRVVRTADARYVGQNWELNIEIPDGDLGPGSDVAITDRFHAEHRRRYTYHLPTRKVELINCRVTALGAVPTPTLSRHPDATEPVDGALIGGRAVAWSGEAWQDTPCYAMERLAPGHQITGPAIVEQFTSTVAIRPGDRAEVDAYRSLIIHVR